MKRLIAATLCMTILTTACFSPGSSSSNAARADESSDVVSADDVATADVATEDGALDLELDPSIPDEVSLEAREAGRALGVARWHVVVSIDDPFVEGVGPEGHIVGEYHPKTTGLTLEGKHIRIEEGPGYEFVYAATTELSGATRMGFWGFVKCTAAYAALILVNFLVLLPAGLAAWIAPEILAGVRTAQAAVDAAIAAGDLAALGPARAALQAAWQKLAAAVTAAIGSVGGALAKAWKEIWEAMQAAYRKYMELVDYIARNCWTVFG